ncbi:MAG: 1,4-dihydroxy-2-naphthoyl-CoA synthase [bacterium]|nr:1,4-dihydroxy-2-naphthoyl-CoA synthase [bacterium]
MDYQDILYEARDHVATITLNRPEVMNAFRARTCIELVDAFQRAGYDREIGAIVLTGAGERAFCTGGDQSSHDDSGGYGGDRGVIGMPIDEVHSVIRDVPKPVLAKVRGYAIGGGNVLATLCDLTLAGASAVFGQVGPKMGSIDPGFGTAYLARVVGEKTAREMWYLCRRYSAEEACEMGLVNKVVPDDDLDAETAAWCMELVERSPTAIALAKRSFNADTESIRGIGALGMQGLALYYGTEESKEGGEAARAKRKPEFRKYS